MGLILLLAGLMLLATGCASPRSVPDDDRVRMQAVEPAVADSAAVQAAETRVDAAREGEGEGGWLEHIELRLNRIRSNLGALDRDLEISTRVFFSNPSEGQAEREVHQAETEIAVAELDEAMLAQMVLRCDRSVETETYRELQTVYAEHALRMEAIKVWVAALAEEGITDELEHYETLLEADVELVSGRPIPSSSTSGGASLPALEVADRPLDQGEMAIRQLIRQYNPSVGGRHAASRRYEALARRELGRQHIYLDFLELSYRPTSGEGWDDLTGQLSVYIPFPGRAGPRSNELFSQAETLDATALEDGLVWVAEDALADLAAFEVDSAAWAELMLLADRAQAVADEWLEARQGEPRDVLRLNRRTFDARTAVIKRRRGAGLAACTLLSASGVPIEAWPRP